MTRELAAWPPAEGGRAPGQHLNRQGFMNILQQAARRLEPFEALDKVAKPWRGRSAARSGRPWCGTCSAAPTWDIPLHPVLTDLPIGAWMMSALLAAADLWSPPASRPPCRQRRRG